MVKAKRSRDMVVPNGAILRAARAGLGWSVHELAEQAGLGVNTIRRAEAEPGPVNMMPANLDRLLNTLAEAGVVLLEADQGGFADGLRLPHRP